MADEYDYAYSAFSVAFSPVKNSLLPADGSVVAGVKLASPLTSSPPPLIGFACTPNSCTLKANRLILALERYVQKSMMWMNGTAHSRQERAREFTVQKRDWLIDNGALHGLCKTREATTWEWMNGSGVLNGWLTTPTPFGEVLANISGTASVKHHYANG